jgi:hypothetical protein
MTGSRVSTPCCFVILWLAIATVGTAPLQAQSLAGRSRLELRMGVGFRSHAGTTASAGGTTTEVHAAGLLGSIGYARWLSERVAGQLSVGVLAADAEARADATGTVNRAAAVVPILAGVRYYFPTSTIGSPWRPFVSAEAGPVVGTESRSEVGAVVVNESVTAGAFDARLGAGLDIQLGRAFMLGLSGGYHFMTDFAEPIAGETNHSGPDAGVSISLLFGRGRAP